MVTTALVVKNHWANLILDGHKSWELRGVATRKRERVGIAISGTSKLWGEARVVDCFKIAQKVEGSLVSLMPLPLSSYEHLHRVSDLNMLTYTNVYAYVLGDPVRYAHPKPYVHHQGAIGWVSLKERKGPMSTRHLR